MELNGNEKKTIENVENLVCSYFGVEIERVMERDTSNEVSYVRNMLYYILHYDFGFSPMKIALRYNRSKRVVQRQCSIIRMCVSSNKSYIDVYKSLKKEIEGAV